MGRLKKSTFKTVWSTSIYQLLLRSKVGICDSQHFHWSADRNHFFLRIDRWIDLSLTLPKYRAKRRSFLYPALPRPLLTQYCGVSLEWDSYLILIDNFPFLSDLYIIVHLSTQATPKQDVSPGSFYRLESRNIIVVPWLWTKCCTVVGRNIARDG